MKLPGTLFNLCFVFRLLMCQHISFRYRRVNLETAIDFTIDVTRKKAKMRKVVDTLNETVFINATVALLPKLDLLIIFLNNSANLIQEFLMVNSLLILVYTSKIELGYQNTFIYTWKMTTIVNCNFY